MCTYANIIEFSQRRKKKEEQNHDKSKTTIYQLFVHVIVNRIGINAATWLRCHRAIQIGRPGNTVHIYFVIHSPFTTIVATRNKWFLVFVFCFLFFLLLQFYYWNKMKWALSPLKHAHNQTTQVTIFSLFYVILVNRKRLTEWSSSNCE